MAHSHKETISRLLLHPKETFKPNSKWEIRKSHDVIIECFSKAFNDTDNVELWMITNNPFLNEEQEKEWLTIVQQSKLRDKIKVFPRLATQENVASRVAWIFAAFGTATIIGGLLGGLVSRKLAPLSALRNAYLAWFITCIPIAFTYPDWTMAFVGTFIGLIGGAVQVFYVEVLEAVRPQGSQTSSLGWIWSVEGSFMAVGAAIGGVVSERYSPRIGLAMLPVMIFIGLIILTVGKGRLNAANDVPTEEEDLRAIKDISNEVK
jgi:MFS family permease